MLANEIVVNSLVIQAVGLAVLCEALAARDSDGFMGVSCLQIAFDPLGVLRGIVSERVNSINFVGIRRRRAFVGQEFFKFLPAFTNANSDSPVIGVREVFGIVATLKHSDPDVIDASVTQPVRSVSLPAGAASGLLFGRFGFPLASAISRSAPSEVGSIDPRSVPTLAGTASTEPKSTVAAPIRSWDRFVFRRNCPVAKGLARHINEWFTHKVFSYIGGFQGLFFRSRRIPVGGLHSQKRGIL